MVNENASRANHTVVPAAAESSNSPEGTPIQRLWDQRNDILAEIAALPTGTSEARVDRHYAQAHEIERQMLGLRSETLADFAAKAIVEVGGGDFVDDWETSPFWAEARALTNTDI